MTCLYSVSSRHCSQTSEPFSITSCFLQEIFPAPHPQPPQAFIWELLLSAACSALLLAYLLLAQKGHWQLLINLEHTDLLKPSTASALLPLLNSLLILLVGGASFAVCNLPSLKSGALLIILIESLHLHFSWTLIRRTEQFGVFCYPPRF